MMEKIAFVVLLWIAAILLGMIIAWPIQLLWNYALVGSITAVNEISFWQAYGIFLLVKLITYTDFNNSFNKNK